MEEYQDEPVSDAVAVNDCCQKDWDRSNSLGRQVPLYHRLHLMKQLYKRVKGLQNPIRP